MNHNSSLPAWLALAVILVGLGSLLLLGIQPSAQPAVANEVAAAQPTVTSNNAIETPLAPNLTPLCHRDPGRHAHTSAATGAA